MFKRRRITHAAAVAAIEFYDQMTITLVKADLKFALEIAARHNIYAYDAYMIVCALTLNCPLISLDKGLKAVAKVAGVPLIEVKLPNANLPGN